jgi:hypothetical protein
MYIRMAKNQRTAGTSRVNSVVQRRERTLNQVIQDPPWQNARGWGALRVFVVFDGVTL